MGSTTFQARFGEDTYPIGRFLLERTRALGLSRRELVSRLGYRQIGKGHEALTAALMTGTVPPQIRKHLAVALEVDDTLVDAVVAATTRQQQDEARALILASEAAYRAAFKPHLRTETTRTIPEPIFIAALLGTARLRHVEVSSEVWNASADDRDRLVKRAIQDHYGERDGYVPAFGSIVSYTLVTMPGYLADYGFPFDTNGDRMGSTRPVERLGEAVLGTKRGATRG
jgi:hypothetical protein